MYFYIEYFLKFFGSFRHILLTSHELHSTFFTSVTHLNYLFKKYKLSISFTFHNTSASVAPFISHLPIPSPIKHYIPFLQTRKSFRSLFQNFIISPEQSKRTTDCFPQCALWSFGIYTVYLTF